MSVNNIPPLKIGELEVNLIQGGMGVGISQSGLASAVAEQGGAGIIASVGLGVLKGYYDDEKKKKENIIRISNASTIEGKKIILGELYEKANSEALRDEIRKARKMTNGVIGVNIMFALSDYPSLIRTASEEKVDLMLTGAGPSLDFNKYIYNDRIKRGPIVNSGKGASQFCKVWKKYGHAPDVIVVEGPMAGGHLGYSVEQLYEPDFVKHGLERIIPEVVEAIRPFEEDYGKKIPVVAAGGIFYGGDIEKYISLGASGVQMATRFVPTHECDANDKFKQAYLDCGKEDLMIINSPVGMPGRAIKNDFLERLQINGERIDFKCDYKCLKTCKQLDSRYCIANALVESQQGIYNRGFVFAGLNAWRCYDMLSVKEVFEKLDYEYKHKITSD